MSVYDIAMIIVFLGAIWFGYWKGLAWQVASVAAIVLSYFVAITFPDAISSYISAEPPFNRFAAMLILFVGTSLVVWTLFASISKSLKKMELKGFDRQAGALVGAVKGAILCMVITMFSVALLGDRARDAIHDSKTGYYVVHGIDRLPGILPDQLAQYIHSYVETFRGNIVDENGLPPQKNPILNRGNDPQQVNETQYSNPGNGFQYSPTQTGGYQPTQAAPAGYQQPVQNPPQWQRGGSYQSGTFSSNQQNGSGYQQGTFGSAGPSQTQWQPPAQQQPQYQNPNQTQWQPPAQQPAANQQNNWGQQFPKISEGENGWPNVQFNVNSKELLQRGAGAALEAGKTWLDNQRQ
jgi:membrane protein required for colicin V production